MLALIYQHQPDPSWQYGCSSAGTAVNRRNAAGGAQSYGCKHGCLWFHRFTIDLYSFKQIYIDVYRSIMICMDLLLSHTSLHVVGQHDVAVVMEVSRFWAFDSWKADLVRRRRSRSRCDVMTWLGGFELLIWVCHGMSENGSTWGIPWYTHQLEGCDVIFY